MANGGHTYSEFPQSIYYLVIISGFLIIGICTRLILHRFNIRLPVKFLVLLFSIAVGSTLAKVEHLRQAWYELNLSPQIAICAYVPVYIMSIAYGMDNHIFSKYLLQATIVTLSTALFTPFVISGILTRVLYSDWTYIHGLLVSIVIIPLEPRHIIDMFQVLSNYKFLATMYEIESVLMITPMTVFLSLVNGYSNGVFTVWYHFVNHILRMLLGGFVIGFAMGFVQLRLLIILHRDPIYAVSVSTLIVYGTYLFCERCGVSPSFGVLVTCYYLIVKKHLLSAEVDKSMQSFWSTFYNLIETPMLMLAMTEVTLYAVLLFRYQTMYAAIFLYCFGLLDRIRATLMVWPLLKCLPYKVNAKCLIVLGWAGVRGTISLYYLLSMVSWQTFTFRMDSYLLSAVCYVLFSNSINCATMPVLLNVMGLRSVASTRLANMYTCLAQLRGKQMNMLEILKASRYLSNANWELVRKQSILDAPYVEDAVKFHKTMQFNEEHLSKWEERDLVCPDCHKVFRDEIGSEEMFERKKTSSLEVLKIQRMSLIKQHENGLITTDILQLLLHHLDTRFVHNQRIKDSRITLEDIKQTNTCLIALEKFLRFIVHDLKYPPPKNNFKKLCYYFVLHVMYEAPLHIIILAHAIFVLWNEDHCCRNWMYWYHLGIWTIFYIDVILKIIAFSSRIQTYKLLPVLSFLWSHRWETFHRCILIISLVNIFTTNHANIFDWFIYYIPSFRTLSALLLVRGIQHFLGSYAPKLIRQIDLRLEREHVKRWTISTAWIASIDEVLQSLSQIIAEKAVRKSYKIDLREERHRLLEEIHTAKIESPFIAVTVKTKQVVRITLMTMDVAVQSMQRAGYTDAIEIAAITRIMMDAHQFHKSNVFIKPNPLRAVFDGIHWMPHDNVDVMERFYMSATLVSKETRDLVMTDGTVAEGVLLLVSGSLVVKYTPPLNYSVVHPGHLPIVDCLSNTNYGLPFEHVIEAGGTVGELSVITDRPYNCNITAATPCQGYWIPKEVILEANASCRNILFGLTAQIWLHACYNLATAIFTRETSYTKACIKEMVLRSVMPNLREYKIFYLPDFLDTSLLIQGTVQDEYGDVYIAPSLIPDTSHSLELLHEEHYEIRLLLVPRVSISPTLIIDYQTDQEALMRQGSDAGYMERQIRTTLF